MLDVAETYVAGASHKQEQEVDVGEEVVVAAGVDVVEVSVAEVVQEVAGGVLQEVVGGVLQEVDVVVALGAEEGFNARDMSYNMFSCEIPCNQAERNLLGVKIHRKATVWLLGRESQMSRG